MSTTARVTRNLTKLDLQSLNRILREIQLDISALQGRGGPTTVEDTLTINGDLGIGKAIIDSDLTATLDGFSGRPVAPWIPGSKNLSDNITTPFLQITQGQHTVTGGLIYYQVRAFRLPLQIITETGIIGYSGARAGGGASSGVSATLISQAATLGVLLVTFSTSNQTETFRINVNADTGFTPDEMHIDYVVWPMMGAVEIV